MSARPSKKPPTRIGTRMRGQMANAYDARGHAAGDLVLHYSAKMQKDVVLCSRLAYYHFLLVERDPSIVRADYAPTERLTRVAGEHFAALVDTEVEMASGEVVWRRLVREVDDQTEHLAALQEAVGRGPLSNVSRLEVLTLKELVAEDTWTRNAHRALAWIAAARAWPLAQHKRAILACLKERFVLSFKDCLDLDGKAAPALYGAALLQLALNGHLQSDLGAVPLGPLSKFSAVREAR